ncbi:MAG: hypothetical protein ACOC3E_02340 [Cyanobacteriota bacterium]
MTPEQITSVLTSLFDAASVEHPSPDAWQIETPQLRLLVILSTDLSWLRSLIPIAPIQQVQPYIEQLLQSNFDLTQETRYAFSQGVLWGVFQHNLETLTPEDFKNAINRLIYLKENGLNDCFEQLVNQQVSQIIRIAKLQGQTFSDTMQSLDRLYAEGLLGGLEQTPEERERFLNAWHKRLESLWSEVQP